jgi:hypothetical protein
MDKLLKYGQLLSMPAVRQTVQAAGGVDTGNVKFIKVIFFCRCKSKKNDCGQLLGGS